MYTTIPAELVFDRRVIFKLRYEQANLNFKLKGVCPCIVTLTLELRLYIYLIFCISTVSAPYFKLHTV